MRDMTLRQVAQFMDGAFSGDPALLDAVVNSAVIDSRKVKPGALFFCFPGERVDGHEFAASALLSGAVCVVSERRMLDLPHILVHSSAAALQKLAARYRETLNLPIIGVTGSVGKTTTKEMISAVLSQRFSVHRTSENLNNELGVPLTVLGIGGSHQIAVVEMGISDFGEMRKLTEIVKPDACVMTRIAESHLETLGDLAGVLRAKSEIFEHMSADSAVFINGDDPYLRSADIPLRRITFGVGADNDYRAGNISVHGLDGIRLNVVAPRAAFAASVPAYGEHIAYAAIAAAALGDYFGLTPDEIKAGLQCYTPVDGRSVIVNTGFLTLIDDCYNANPASMKNALRSLCALDTRCVAILGDMLELGSASNELHREIGNLVASLGVDCLICCGAKAEFIFKGYIAAGGQREVFYFPFIEKLIERLPALLKPGDAVLVKASHGMDFRRVADYLSDFR